MTEDTDTMSEETRCTHPECETVVRDEHGENVVFTLPDGSEYRGGACPVHAEWFAREIAGFNGGEIAAVEAMTEAARAESNGELPLL